MKLEYLDDLSEGGKYKGVVSENLIRLYDFEQDETNLLVNLINQQLIINQQGLDLTTVAFIQPVNCSLILQLAPNDEGIVVTVEAGFFICKLTEQTYIKALADMKAVKDGYNWLCDTSRDNIDFLYSAGGTW